MSDDASRTTFHEMLSGETFHYGVELVSSRGLPKVGGTDSKLLREAEELAQSGGESDAVLGSKATGVWEAIDVPDLGLTDGGAQSSSLSLRKTFPVYNSIRRW